MHTSAHTPLFCPDFCRRETVARSPVSAVTVIDQGDDGCSSLISQSGGLITRLLLAFKLMRAGEAWRRGEEEINSQPHAPHLSPPPPLLR